MSIRVHVPYNFAMKGILYSVIHTLYSFRAFRSESSLQQRKRVKQELQRMRQKKRRQNRESHFRDDSSLSSISVMDKYALDDTQSLVQFIPALLAKPKYVPRSHMWNPFSLKNSLEYKVPSTAYEVFAPVINSQNEETPNPGSSAAVIPIKSSTTVIDSQNEETPNPGSSTVVIPVKSSTTVRRRLFEKPSINERTSSESVDQVAKWVSMTDPLQDSESECGDNSTAVGEEKYGFPLPSWLQDESAPKLATEHRCLPSIPVTKEKRMAVAKDNHQIVSQWLRDCAVAKRVGSGSEVPLAKAIQRAGKSAFENQAKVVLDSLNSLHRYPIGQYINELKAKETEAITTARMFRDKYEESERERTRDALQKKDEILGIRTFWRKNVAEQGSRGGRMVNLSLNKVSGDKD